MAARIHVIGAGAIGKALAVCLANAGRDIILIRGSKDDQPDEVESIRLNLSDGSMLQANLKIKTFSAIKEADGIFVVASKSLANEGIADKLQKLAINAPVVLLQNGLNIERPFLSKGFRNLYRCVLLATSQFETTDALRFRPVAASPIGSIDSEAAFNEVVVDQLHTNWFPFIRVDHIHKMVWQKAIVNCVFNSVCPLLEVDNGVFHREPAAMQLADYIIEECILIADHSGLSLRLEDIRNTLLSISRASDGQFISTLQDIRNHRPTEIETLNLEVAAIARSLGLEDKVAITRTLGELTALKSYLNR
ncbi:2-dehydropantoate 2-reductase [Mucilaginibacter limnophilus]|uniref:2-dehydropantoate 2-reductase n=1 Tax=Mucilaginibacter limnophilus TaxID=1932778 RepID=A0A437MTM0_9SPHI|nr:2-dehydropantoate 2-reductase [Mucilaginibacter limnophilus]RVU01007.1 2-dehydropantoate 2-reductase [Mucilaginibacter limnophilus]